MKLLRTAVDVRSYLLKHWRKIIPELLVTRTRVSLSAEDENLLQVDLPGDGPVQRLLLLPLASGEPRLVRGLLPRLRELGCRRDTWAGFVVPHMGASGVKICREAGVGYIDCCGNAYLQFNSVVVQIYGNRNKFASRKRPRTVFNDKATIPLRILLENPGALVTTREIADRGGMSLGWVSQILQQLHSNGYVERKRGGGTRIINPPRLIGDWLQQYTFEHNSVFPFRMKNSRPSETLQEIRSLRPPLFERYALTLDSAVAALKGQSNVKQLHLYLPDLSHKRDQALQMWSEALQLKPAGYDANCFLVGPTYKFATFFGMHRVEGLRVVSDLQLYLDLFHSHGASRPKSQATVISRLPFTVESATAN